MDHPPGHYWWQTAVVYQIYPRSFRDTSGNGVGDLEGIIERLDHVSRTLGVDAIWMSPFYPSPNADFGYDVSDYRDIDPLFGDLAIFDRLVESAHHEGLKVIVDFVPNHTSDRHRWFVESRGSRDNPKRDWYVWRDPQPDGSLPNNWLSVFGGPAWTLDDRTGQFYLHSFLVEQPDLNWRNRVLREAMYDNMRFWLDRGVDGFRVDAVPFLMKDPAERDNPPAGDSDVRGHKSMGAYDSQKHLYDKQHHDIHEVFREMRAVTDEYDPPRLTLGEMHIFEPEELARYYGDLDELSMPCNFGLLKAPWTAAGIRGAVDGLEAALPEGAWPNWVLGNHDDKRMATRLGEPQSRQAAVLLLTLRGSPTLYYGDEIGMLEADIPPEKQKDPWGIREPGLGRDGCRTPMQWSAETGAGFTRSNAEPWLPIGPGLEERNVATQLGDPGSHLELYRRLLDLRRSSQALRRGSYRSLGPVPDGGFAYAREQDDERAVVVLNFSPEPLSVEHPEIAGRVAVSTHRASESLEVAGAVELAPHEGVVLSNRAPR